MMKRSAVFGLACALSALLVVATHAQGTAFTYQGFLKQNGNPVNGSVNLTFKLFTALTGGSQLGPTLTQNNVSVSNGLFTVELDFGNVWNGNARYLEIAVNNNTLSPRVKINPTPYAVRAGTANPIGSAGGDLSGTYPNPTVAKIQGRSVSTATPSTGQVLKWNGSAWAPAGDLRDAYWQASGSNIFYNSGNVGIGTAAPATRLDILGGNWNTETTEGDLRIGNATYRLKIGIATGGAGAGNVTIAAQGGTGSSNRLSLGAGNTLATQRTLNITAAGKVGIGTTSPAYPLHVETSTGSGSPAIYGYNTATSGTTVGVWGVSDSTNGRGVYGLATATSGTNHGGRFISDSTSGTGVSGFASATSGTTYGVYGKTNSPNGRGVSGEASANSGTNYGGRFISKSTSGTGVYGEATATSGTTYGVYGRTNSPDGYGGYFVGRGYFSGKVGIGTTNPAAELHVNGTARVKVLEITGADLAEKFPISEQDIQPGMVVEIDPDHPGNLRLCRTAYSKRVAGVVAGANGLSKGIVLGNLEGSEHHLPIAMSGRVWVYADATQGAIEPGDMLTSSSRPGYATKVTDLSKAHGAIIGKAMTALKQGETGFVLVLVNLH